MHPAETPIREADYAWVSPSELRQVRITEPVSRFGKGLIWDAADCGFQWEELGLDRGGG